MPAANYRIESANPMQGPLLPVTGASELLVRDSAVAVVMAAKSETVPLGQEIRVVHIPTGEVIFRKATAPERADGHD